MSGGCPVMRHIRITTSTLSFSTFEQVGPSKVEWVTRACDTPLFGAERAAMKCRSCQTGWEAPGSRLASNCTLEEAIAQAAAGEKK